MIAGFPVPGRPDLICPVPAAVIRAMRRHARAHPWPGDAPLTCPGHKLDTTAITEPGRLVRVLFSFDVGYHQSGWFANSDWDANYHISVSCPRPDQRRMFPARPEIGINKSYEGMGLETPTDDEVRAWGLVFYSAEHAPKAWFEPAASVFDPYRQPNVTHLRLFIDRRGQPFIPEGEPYHIRPWADGSSPPKITEGRLGADVR